MRYLATLLSTTGSTAEEGVCLKNFSSRKFFSWVSNAFRVPSENLCLSPNDGIVFLRFLAYSFFFLPSILLCTRVFSVRIFVYLCYTCKFVALVFAFSILNQLTSGSNPSILAEYQFSYQNIFGFFAYS